MKRPERRPDPAAARPAGRRASSARRPGLHARLRAYLWHHGHALQANLAKVRSAPLASLMTAAVIGIALALPAGLYVVLENLESVTRGWDRTARISLFLQSDLEDGAAKALARRLEQRDDIAATQPIPRAQAMAEFRQLSGFGEALDALQRNPLPAVVVVTPAPDQRSPSRVEALAEALGEVAEVDIAQVDMQWVRRLYTLMAIGRRAVLVVGGLLSLAVLLIVGNTIRLEIQNRREEIEVTKLIGGTDAFIRRPFLYSGLLYGLAGGALAWTLVELGLSLLRGPAQHLAGLYGSGFYLAHLPMGESLVLVLAGSALGLAGSWLAVGRHLAEIEPG